MSEPLAFTRRGILVGGCAAAVTMALPLSAQASPLARTLAPRHHCPHDGCRHYRPDDTGPAEDTILGPMGICALSLHGEVVPQGQVAP